MKTEITMDQLWENLKSLGEEEKNILETADEVSKIVSYLVTTRIQKGLSQRQLADICQIKQSALARLETLQAIPRLDTLVKIANCLDIRFIPMEKEDFKEKVQLTVISYTVPNNKFKIA